MCVVTVNVIALCTANFTAIAQTMSTIRTWKRFHALRSQNCCGFCRIMITHQNLDLMNLKSKLLRSFATLMVTLQIFLAILLATKQTVCLDFAI